MVEQESPLIKVLMVDDNKMVRSLMREIVNEEGDVRIMAEADSTHEATKHLENNTFDIVIMDISLKDGVGGLAFLKEMRQKGMKTPFIMVSAHEEEVYARNSLESNAQGYISKSKLVPCLVKAIREVFAGRTFVSSQCAG